MRNPTLIKQSLLFILLILRAAGEVERLTGGCGARLQRAERGVQVRQVSVAAAGIVPVLRFNCKRNEPLLERRRLAQASQAHEAESDFVQYPRLIFWLVYLWFLGYITFNEKLKEQ